MNLPFHEKRRQQFLDEVYYKARLQGDKSFLNGYKKDLETDHSLTLENKADMTRIYANTLLTTIFTLQYTGGESIENLRNQFDEVVDAYLEAIKQDRLFQDEPELPMFLFGYLENYLDVIRLISFAILLRREDRIADIYSLFKDGEPDGEDALVEELLSRYLPDRPYLSECYHDLFINLLNVTADTPAAEKIEDMKLYLKEWYSEMEQTAFYDSHLEQAADGSGGYYGYWAFEAGAIAYLYDLDDSAFADHLIYPKDLVDFAKNFPDAAI
ncbi:hypothetical protein MmiEs2_06010 [Methanimicrococcus stummii]|uniref:DUF1911 domain-containing protein n=1 Tax=Methanimicrococcus stummii TaxID=3028294 RepID=A0AA96ZY32_9EURY|nr:PoNe immunity protein domain-containing protein [Methanimicrococcus sp. Es2]WNY28416.1 hypothetical protein MmiEs2_06010 [Methanimicrococcus sp. Es2]